VIHFISYSIYTVDDKKKFMSLQLNILSHCEIVAVDYLANYSRMTLPHVHMK
jgi:hypothetical protein